MFSFVGRPAQILAPNEGKTNFLVLVCGNAIGQFVPANIIYKGSDISISFGWISNGPEDATYNTSKNGWMTAECFQAWIKWFDKYLEKSSIQKPVVLLMDGCSSHISLSIVEEARSRRIILVKLPSNATHVLLKIYT